MPDKMINNIYWLGHDSFYITGSKVIYIDPWEIKGKEKADMIFISHDHYDHCSPDDVAKISKDSTVIITDADSAKKLSGNIKVIKPGDNIEVDGVKVTGVPSYNTNKNFHTKDKNWLGFVIELDSVKIYFAGDTDYISEMNNLEVDIAIIPVSGTYVMDAKEAVEAARAIKPKIAIPMHYGKIVGSVDDAEKFAEALKDEMKIVIKEKV